MTFLGVKVRDLVSVMEEAGKDVRVKGVLATLPDTMGKGLGGIAQVQEVRFACRCSSPLRHAAVSSYSPPPPPYVDDHHQRLL